MNLYELLAVSPSASKQELGKAIALAEENKTLNSSVLMEARKVLLDDPKRAIYDIKLSKLAKTSLADDVVKMQGEKESSFPFCRCQGTQKNSDLTSTTCPVCGKKRPPRNLSGKLFRYIN